MNRLRSLSTLSPLFVPVLAGLVAFLAPPPEDPAPTARADGSGVAFSFRIEDETGTPIPGRLTFVGSDGSTLALFENPDADPDRLAVRPGVLYTLEGTGLVTVPPGTYEVYASRGLEWSLASQELVFRPGETTHWTAVLKHELDTSGWISGDFHLHTLTHSGHGDANMKERVISLVGEGVEFAVATDHDHNTDYGPTVTELGAADALKTVVGNEVSTPIGHFNAFPLDPARAPVDSDLRDAHELFRLIRAEKNPLGISPVVQVNHPRWRGIDYFTRTGLDPITGQSDDRNYSPDFDSIEILNENTAWGFRDPATSDVETGSNDFSVLQDWFHLLNRGYRYAAVGNSDSHSVAHVFAGYPRNFVRSSTDDPRAIDPAEVADNIRAKACFTTTGPFLELEVNGVTSGGLADAPEGMIEVRVRLQAASWVDCDTVSVIVNGDVLRRLHVNDEGPLPIEKTFELRLREDAWVVLVAEGDEPLAPVLAGHDRPVLPIAVTNPVWVDYKSDGVFTSLYDQVGNAFQQGITIKYFSEKSFEDSKPAGRWAHMLFAPLENRVATVALVNRAVGDDSREVRLAAARAAEFMSSKFTTFFLKRAFDREDTDAYLACALYRALIACEPEFRRFEQLESYIERFGIAAFRRYQAEFAPFLDSGVVRQALVLGPFPAPTAGTVQSTDLGPEGDADPERIWTRADGAALGWTELGANEAGFFDLRSLGAAPTNTENGMAYAQVWLKAPRAGSVPAFLGTDDGCRLLLNSEVLHDVSERRGARPLDDFVTLPLEEGWNRLLLKVENGSGGFGFYLRVLDDAVEVSTRRGS